jgi:F-type H+-transporting ATPase subunit b
MTDLGVPNRNSVIFKNLVPSPKVLLRAFSLAVFFLTALSPASLAQQAPAAAPAQSSGSNAASAPAPANSNQASGSTPQESPGPSETLQEDETAAFKHSPAVQWIAKIIGVSRETAYWICVVINFAIIAVAIIFLLKSSLPGMFRTRTQSIQKEMEEARHASHEAQHRLKEIEDRLARMNIEIGEMQARAESDSKAEEERIRASIEEEKQKILQSAEQEVEQATSAARRDLQKYAVTLAVEMAEKGLRIDANEDKALVDDFTSQLAAETRRNGGS